MFLIVNIPYSIDGRHVVTVTGNCNIQLKCMSSQ